MKRFREFLKRILPPPVKSFMREVKNILYAINGSKNEVKSTVQKLDGKIERLLKENAAIQAKLSEQNAEIKRLYALFESANRENLRIFLESKEERERLHIEYQNERQKLLSTLKDIEKNREHLRIEHQNEKQKLLNALTDTEKIREQVQEPIKTMSQNIIKLLNTVPERNLYNNDYERRVTLSFKEYRERPDYPDKLLNLLLGLDDESAATVIRVLLRQEKIWGTEGKSLNILTDEEDKQIRYIRQHLYGNILKIADDIYCYRNYLLPINHFEPCVFVYHYGLDRIKDKSRFANKCIIDVGAFIGDSALILSPLTSSKVYAFEATSKYYDLLQQTIKLNNLKNVVPVHAALGATCGRTEINVANSSSSILKPYIDSEGKEEVELITLDSFVKKHDLEVGLIKVDIEGYEQKFLKGAENTIKKQKPTLIVSIYHNPDDFFTIKPTIDNWKLGYKFKVFKPSDFSISREVLLIAEAFD